MSTGETQSVNDIRTAIRELTARAKLARKEGRPDDAAELEQRIDGYRERTRSRSRPVTPSIGDGTATGQPSSRRNVLR